MRRSSSVKNIFSRTPSTHASQIKPPPRRPSPYSSSALNKSDTSRQNIYVDRFNNSTIISNKNIKTFEGVEIYPETKSIYAQNNSIKNFTGLKSLQHLEAVDLSNNCIENFAGFPELPQLKSINLLNNPISKERYFRVALVILCGSTLRTINGERISPSDRKLAAAYLKETHILIRHGWNVTFPPPSKDCFQNIKKSLISHEEPKQTSPSKPSLRLHSMSDSFMRRIKDQETEKKRLQSLLGKK
ncbi:hypothetical protein TVAG_440670 [Trichomonas vaginalis G3]|uniref:Leucine Rich Repeat family protein n=1 Tax=Trichomonas vaginalis (strain ATCC PRA-98 / G3) TaxID=412133 RepID=A2G7V5_TRIV3|nr:ribonuclease inhibitor domain-containing protein [Trichomonas vaginalis G3]EAX86755.1 hypothetical protein TVAG_440670 [Trichomonas vaginalis G3]KAI5494654.1 ribonuclease inhibitor domain-containing protein [Trichomonas vaginalis G3]|eukprot:XP_001299685.1 hypothetical protein [Trichomonas vaginalis G3]